MNSKTPLTPLWYRLSALGLGILLLFWLPIEDLNIFWVVLLAAALSALVAVRFFVSSPASGGSGAVAGRKPFGMGSSFWAYPLAGVLAGSSTPLAAILLMIFKSGLHGHPSPDFTPAQVIGVLSGLPSWIIGGALLGVGTGIYLQVR